MIIWTYVFICILHTILEFIPFSSSFIIDVLCFSGRNTHRYMSVELLHGYAGVGAFVFYIKECVGMLINWNKFRFVLLSTFTTLLTLFLFYKSGRCVASPIYIGLIACVIFFIVLVVRRSYKMDYSMITAIGLGFCHGLSVLLPGSSRMGCGLIYLLGSGYSLYYSLQTVIIVGIPLNLLLFLRNSSPINPLLMGFCVLTACITLYFIEQTEVEHWYLLILIRLLFLLYLLNPIYVI